jgi:hypothetical protein
MNLRSIIATLACVVFFAGCSSSTHTSDSLAGTYGVSNPKTGQIEPFVKIDAVGDGKDGYVLYEYHKGEWQRPKKAWADTPTEQPVTSFQRADLEKVVHHQLDVDVNGIQVPSFAVVHVPAGWSDGAASRPFETKSGFFALTLLGPVDLVRM